MTGLTLPAACLCLMTGALLGGLFLFFKLLRGQIGRASCRERV